MGLQPAVHAASAAPAVHPVYVEVTLNGQTLTDELLAMRDSDGRIFVGSTDIASWRLNLGSPPGVEQDGVRYLMLDGIPGLALEFDEARQRLILNAAPDLFVPATISVAHRDPLPMTPSGSGAFINYDLYAQTGGGETGGGAFLEVGAFAGGGFGASGFVGRWTETTSDILRLETNWTFDDPDALRSLRLGDSIARGGAATPPFRFGGVQWGSNFTIRPGYLTMPMPTVEGSAALPSTADVYVNGMLTAHEAVSPGPFQITNPPALMGRGDVSLVVRDLLGRQSVTTLNYYVAGELLRPGLHDYSYEAGFLRHDFGLKSMSYGDFMASGTHRYGLNDWLTGELHGEASRHRQLASASATMLVAREGVLTLSGAASNGPGGSGGLVSIAVDRRTLGLSFGASAEFASRNFGGVWATSSYRLPRQTIRALVSMPLGRARVAANYLSRRWWDGQRDELIGLTASAPLGRLASLNLSAFHSRGEQRATVFELFVSMPLGRNTNVSAGYQGGSTGHTATASIQRNLPTDEGYGYYATAALGTAARFDGTFVYQTDVQTYEAAFSHLEGRSAVRGSLRGSFALVGGDLIAARQLTDSFAIVDTGYEGVRVYADNALVGRTDASGRLVVPRLRAYDENRVRVEQGDLPMDVGVSPLERAIRPYARHGVRIAYETPRARAATMVVVREDGAPVPPGAWARVEGAPGRFIVAPDGTLYLAGLAAENRVSVEWAGGACAFALAYRPGEDPQPDLGRQICRSSTSEAD